MTTRRAGARPSRPRTRRGAAGRAAEALRDGVPGLRTFLGAHRVPAICCLVAAVVVAALYGPACDLYRAWRDNGVKAAEASALTAESEEVQGDIDTLMTEDGIKDEARRRGYVDEGETRIVVEGGEEQDDPADAQADETPWYLGVGDFIFQYHPSGEGEQ